MSSLLLCCASGAPGVTVTALGLTLTWPRDVLLVDADRTPSRSILAGYLRGTSAHNHGLSGILQAHRERRPLTDALVAQSMPLDNVLASRRAAAGPAVSRRFLPGFANLGSIDVFGSVWRDFGAAMKSAPFDTIVDAGRIGSRGLPSDLVESVDRIGVVCRSSLVSLAALQLYLAPLLDAVAPERVGLVMIGSGRPYSAQEVSRQFGVSLLAEIAWQPGPAADLQHGLSRPRRWGRQPLGASYERAAAHVLSLHEAERQRVGAPV